MNLILKGFDYMLIDSVEDIDFSKKLVFEKSQADQYFIYCDGRDVGTIFGRNYHSSPKNRLWDVRLEYDSFTEESIEHSLQDAKSAAKSLWSKVVSRYKKWEAEM